VPLATILKLETCDGFTTIQIAEQEAWVKQALRPFRDAIFETQQHEGSTHDGNELLEALERLAELRDRGALDDVQFETAKNRLLDI